MRQSSQSRLHLCLNSWLSLFIPCVSVDPAVLLSDGVGKSHQRVEKHQGRKLTGLHRCEIKRNGNRLISHDGAGGGLCHLISAGTDDWVRRRWRVVGVH